ncbi:hypothetical protein [Natronorubrum bangense]|uniref:hypothetical protein n=1 Tax=Natronorubrum bangense TaxID=61858 RepID=UPI001267B092|nr:hypothetical protein [Natronorubrum bangense]
MVPSDDCQAQMSLLFYTVADRKYEMFIPLYIHYTLRSNPSSHIEIGLEDPCRYEQENSEIINILGSKYGNKFKLSKVNFGNNRPGAVRFVTEPDLADEHEYVYIGDIDILIFDSGIESKHVEYMSENNIPFSNIVRSTDGVPENKYRLSGLHFAPTDLQYPLPKLDGINYSLDNQFVGADENALYKIMERKGQMIPFDLDYRPEHGIHMRSFHPFGKRRDGSTPEPSFEEISNGNQEAAWTGLENEEYRKSFLNSLDEKTFKKMYSHLDMRVKNRLLVLENACRGRFELLEEDAFKYIIRESRRERLLRSLIYSLNRKGLKNTLSQKIVPYLVRTANRHLKKYV